MSARGARVQTSEAILPGAGLLAAMLAITALIELLILRTFTRTAIHIPAIEALQEPYEGLAFAGRYAYFVSVALLMLVLPASAWRLWKSGSVTGVVAAGAVVLFLSVAAAGSMSAVDRPVLDFATLLTIAVLAGAGAFALTHPRGWPVLIFAVAFTLSGIHTLAQSAAQEGVASLDTSFVLLPAEAAGVAFALSIPLLLGTIRDRTALLAGLGVAVVTLAVFLGNGSTSRFLLLWNEGLSGVLPGLFYALAAGALAGTAVGLLRARQWMLAAAVALLVAGGIGLHNTYQTGLVVTALTLLCLGASEQAGDRGRQPASH